MSEVPIKTGPFTALSKTDFREQVARVLDGARASGLPCTYLSIAHTTVKRGEGAPLERLLLDLAASDLHGELDERHVISARDGSASIDTSRKTFYLRAFANAEAVISALADLRLHHLCNRAHWYANEGLVTGDWNYWLDPANDWPLWLCSFGCDLELAADAGPPGGRGGDAGLPNDVSWAAKIAAGTVGLMPFVGIRLKQDLIRMDRGRLRRLDARTEQASVPFALGTLGWNYVRANNAELRYKLFGEGQSVVHEGSVRLGDDELKYGADLMVPEGREDRRIFGTDLTLLLNGAVVDRSVGTYIRSIKASIGMKKG